MPNRMMLTLQAMRKLAYGQCITLKSAPKISGAGKYTAQCQHALSPLEKPYHHYRDEAEAKEQHAHYKNECGPLKVKGFEEATKQDGGGRCHANPHSKL